MTVVYIESLFLLNFVIDYLILLASVKLAGEVVRRLRLASGAAVGALYAAMIFLPGMEFLAHPVCKLGAAVLMSLTAFGGSRRLARLILVFLGVSCALAGGVLAVGLLGGRGLTLRGGVIYSAMDLKLVLLSAACCYVLLATVFSRAAAHGARRDLAPAILTLEGKKLTLTVLVDTGNTLTDPVSGRAVMVAEGERLSPLFPPGYALDAAALRDPVAALERLSAAGRGKRFRLLPYQAVGVECGMLLAVRMDAVRVGERDYGGILVALAPNRLSDGGGYSALIGA
jgi:stage II sporulation protein GA (sporulation sigma-E factor processing peptidase)